MGSCCVCDELWERALMTTAAQLKGAPGHVAFEPRTGCFPAKLLGKVFKYSLAGVQN